MPDALYLSPDGRYGRVATTDYVAPARASSLVPLALLAGVGAILLTQGGGGTVRPQLTTRQRNALPPRDFVFPNRRGGKRGGGYPIEDIEHGKRALARSLHATPADRRKIQRDVFRRYPSLRPWFRERHPHAAIDARL